MLLALLALGQARATDTRWPGLHISQSPAKPSPPAAPPPPPAPDGVFSAGHRCGNVHAPIDMFVDSPAGCQALAMGLKHDKAGTLEYFAWSDFTLYCYACAESEVKGSNLVPDSHYDVYEVYARPFYDPVAAWAHKPPCYDTPGWHSPDFDTCQAYVERRWCIDGNIEWAEHYGGVAFRSPEKNCCACGGGSAVAPAPSPPPSHNPLPCVDLKLQGMPDAAHHLVLLTVPGQQPAGVVLSAWRDPLSKRCSDYAIKGWCSNGRVLSERVTGIRNHNPEDACCVCGTCKGRAFSLARPQCSRLPLTRF